MPNWLGSVLAKIDKELNLFAGPANHVLVNAYEPGEGILVCLMHLTVAVKQHATRHALDFTD